MLVDEPGQALLADADQLGDRVPAEAHVGVDADPLGQCALGFSLGLVPQLALDLLTRLLVSQLSAGGQSQAGDRVAI